MKTSLESYDVAVITVNYNSSDSTRTCVAALNLTKPANLTLKIIIVDNNSSPEEFEKLLTLKDDPNITIVRNKINSGFASANMLGVNCVNAKYYFFLNNDCVVQPGCLFELKKFADAELRGGMFSPHFVDRNLQPIPSFDFFPEILSKFLGRGVFFFLRGPDYHSRKQLPSRPIMVDVLSGSHMFVRASAFHAIGGFDTNFFLYCEEEDLALRMARAGYARFLVPTALNYHVGGVSTLRTVDIKKEFLISFLYLYRKHYGAWKTQLLKIFLMLRYLRRSFTEPDSWPLVVFVALGAPMALSFRHKQVMIRLKTHEVDWSGN